MVNGGKRLVVVRWSRAPRLGRTELALVPARHRQAGQREAERDGSGLQHPVLRFGLVEGPTTEHLVHLPFGVQPASDLSAAVAQRLDAHAS